jgi:hypothetical protein
LKKFGNFLSFWAFLQFLTIHDAQKRNELTLRFFSGPPNDEFFAWMDRYWSLHVIYVLGWPFQFTGCKEKLKNYLKKNMFLPLFQTPRCASEAVLGKLIFIHFGEVILHDLKLYRQLYIPIFPNLPSDQKMDQEKSLKSALLDHVALLTLFLVIIFKRGF